MSKMTIEINEDLENRLREAAAQEHRPEEELLMDAIRYYLQSDMRNPMWLSPDAYDPLRRMIGLIPDGLTDASVYHDVRPNESV